MGTLLLDRAFAQLDAQPVHRPRHRGVGVNRRTRDYQPRHLAGAR